MFSTARNELRELMHLVRELAVYDNTLAANPSIQPSDDSHTGRRMKEQRLIELQIKYELV